MGGIMYRPEGWNSEKVLDDVLHSMELGTYKDKDNELSYYDCITARELQKLVEAGADAMQQSIIEFLEQEMLGHAQFLEYWLIPKKHWNKLKG